MKNKFQQWKDAIKNPPADRLARIEYQSHILQMLGITIVSVALIIKGLWYIIFAFVFALGINYAGAVNNYRKYQNIKQFMPKEEPKDYKEDISPTRRKTKIITHVYGSNIRWWCIILSVISTFLIFEFSFNFVWWQRSIFYPLLIGFLFWGTYFVIAYLFAKKEYDKEFSEVGK